jgi:D-alanyl-D-alanine carboxypeptidase
MKSKIKAILPIALALIVFFALSLAIHFNSYKIFLFFEKNGTFLDGVELKRAELAGDMRWYSLSGLKADEKVIFDQSLMLINTEYTLPEGFVPEISEYKDTEVYMNSCMIEAYGALSAAVRERFDKKLYVSDDLRTEEEQEELYELMPDTATKPGASEHQSGLALDIYTAYYAGDSFIKSPVGRFVNAECYKYGFIIRYPSFGKEITGIRFEPWHIRYVGEVHANIIYNNHLTLEEYVLSFEVGEWYESDGYLISRQALIDGELILPESFESCTISPDNTGYYIVTVK